MLNRTVGVLRWVVLMPGENYTVLTTITNAAVESFVLPAFGVLLETLAIMPNKFVVLLITARFTILRNV
jgi:hypothetical protein